MSQVAEFSFDLSYRERQRLYNRWYRQDHKEEISLKRKLKYRQLHPAPPKPDYLRLCRVCGKKACCEEDLGLFKVSHGQPFNRDNICNECHRKINRNYVRLNTEKISVYKKKWKQNNKAKVAQYEKKHSKKIRRIKQIEKQTRDLGVPLASSCFRCGSNENLVRHHPDYSKPLEIVTLCRKCHGFVHRPYPSEVRD